MRSVGSHSRPRMAAVEAAAVSVCLALAGCTGSGGANADESNGPATITFWDNNLGPERAPVWKHIIADFEKANPTIKVSYAGYPITEIQKRYDAAIAHGGLPDVGMVSTAYLSDVADKNALEPLDERVAGSSLYGRLTKAYVDLVKSAGPDAQLYTLPTSSNIAVLWLRKDLLDAAKLPVPTSWDEFYADVTKLTDKSKRKYGFTIRGSTGSIPQILEDMYAQSGIRTIFDDQDRSTVNDPANITALEKIVELYGAETPTADVNNDYKKMVAEFDAQSIAVMQHNLGSYADHVKAFGKDKIIGVPLFPAPSGRHNVVSNPVDGVGVFKSSKHTEQAWKFAEYVASQQADSYWNQQVGQIPANKEVAREGWLRRDQPLRDALSVVTDVTTNVVQLPYYLPQFNSIVKAGSEPQFKKVLLGQMTVTAVLNDLAQKLTDAKAKFK